MICLNVFNVFYKYISFRQVFKEYFLDSVKLIQYELIKLSKNFTYLLQGTKEKSIVKNIIIYICLDELIELYY